MKRFCIKFCLLFFLIDGFIALYYFGIYPSISGDIGKLGQIPFGQEYIQQVNENYPHERLMVQAISPADSITASLITIGDSFSQQEERGYGQFLAEIINRDIQNIYYPQTPEQTLVQLLYHNKIPPKATVILEVVERCMFWRLNWIDYQDTTQVVKREEPEVVKTSQDNKRILQNAMQFLKKSVGIQQPIVNYTISQDLFSHPSRSRRLYIYNSRWDHDGDLHFTSLTEKDIYYAYQNMYTLHQLAESHGVNLIILIAADKYDVYEPFITSKHLRNPALDACPDESWIINTKSLLQTQAYAGTKDLYYVNDTHWSPVGAKLVAEEIYRRLYPD